LIFSLSFFGSEYGQLRSHLLAAAPREQGAFAYFSTDDLGGALHVKAVELLGESDFVAQHEDYLEIADETRQRVIRQAHERQLGVIEFHSHPFPVAAQFSTADYNGLQETVPHMLWRLKGRPYGAVVVAPRDFDGLIWLPDQSVRQLDLIVDRDGEYAPTRKSISQWQ
jgi:hypothetical protein